MTYGISGQGLTKFVAVSLSAVLLLAACSATSSNTMHRVVLGDWATYGPTKLVYALSKGPVPVVVQGDPYNEGNALSERVVALMQGKPAWAPRGTYVAASDPGDSAYYLTFVFDPPPGYSGHDACAGQYPRPDSRSSSGAVVAAFCSSARLESEIKGQSANIADSSSAEFARFISLVMTELLPHRPGHLGPSILTN